jgi:hypothetical protein
MTFVGFLNSGNGLVNPNDKVAFVNGSVVSHQCDLCGEVKSDIVLFDRVFECKI